MGRRLVTVHEDFLTDDSALPLNVGGSQLWIHIKIAKHVTESREELGGRDRVIAGALLGRVSVHVPSYPFDFLHNPPSGSPCSAFKEHMLNKVRYTAELCRFVAASDAGPNPKGRRFRVGHFASGYSETIRQAR